MPVLRVSALQVAGLVEEAVDVDGVFCGDVDFARGDGGDVEAQAEAGTVARAVLFAVVEFMLDVRGVEGVQDGGRVGRAPAFRSNHPDDAVARSVGGDGWRRAGIDEFYRALPRGDRREHSIL